MPIRALIIQAAKVYELHEAKDETFKIILEKKDNELLPELNKQDKKLKTDSLIKNLFSALIQTAKLENHETTFEEASEKISHLEKYTPVWTLNPFAGHSSLNVEYKNFITATRTCIKQLSNDVSSFRVTWMEEEKTHPVNHELIKDVVKVLTNKQQLDHSFKLIPTSSADYNKIQTLQNTISQYIKLLMNPKIGEEIETSIETIKKEFEELISKVRTQPSWSTLFFHARPEFMFCYAAKNILDILKNRDITNITQRDMEICQIAVNSQREEPLEKATLSLA